MNEFLTLSKPTGLSKMALRVRFREKDYGNSGVLSVQDMKEVLSALRGEGTKVDKSLIQGYKENAHPVIPFSSADVPPVGE